MSALQDRDLYRCIMWEKRKYSEYRKQDFDQV